MKDKKQTSLLLSLYYYYYYYIIVINLAYKPVAMQQENRHTPVSMQWSRYCWTITMETVFSTRFVPKCYKYG
jgi:hypothetical protein